MEDILGGCSFCRKKDNCENKKHFDYFRSFVSEYPFLIIKCKDYDSLLTNGEVVKYPCSLELY